MNDVTALASAVIDGDRRALARAITVIERRDSGFEELVGQLHRRGSDVPIVGITGSPGAGKSTIVAELVRQYRSQGELVGIIGIDPTSPVSGGAILGDRIRLGEAMRDPAIFYRSMSTGGASGGLAPAVPDVVAAYEAADMDRIIIETVGAGQSEIDVVGVGDTVVVVLQPGSGDDVQMLKAGILEIGDVFVVNKMDRPDADRTVAQLHHMIELGEKQESWNWTPPIIETTATSGAGISTLCDALANHAAASSRTDRFAGRRRRRYSTDVRRLLRTAFESRLDTYLEQERIDDVVERIRRREIDPHEAADRMAAELMPTESENGGHNEGHGLRSQ